MADTHISTYAEAMKQTSREAEATVIALAAIVVVWLVAGFGLAGTDIWVFHTPLWVVCGCVLPWVAAVIAALVLGYKVFADFDLDEVAAEGAASGVEAASSAGAGRPIANKAGDQHE
jgi:uncharacterized membrane protein YhdT